METPQGWPIGMVQVIKTGEEIPRKFFIKTLDKFNILCYNKDTKGKKIKNMYTYEIQLAYDEYCMDCYWEGITPKPIWEWWEGEE